MDFGFADFGFKISDKMEAVQTFAPACVECDACQACESCDRTCESCESCQSSSDS